MEEVAGVFILPSIAILGWQCFHWLKDGFWTPLPISKLFTYNRWPLPQVNWLGAQKIIDWLLDTPSSVVAFILGIAGIVVSSFLKRRTGKCGARRAMIS